MVEYKAEILAVGTELLLGQIANTNAQWLSEQLADHGISVYFHGVVGDNLERVRSTFELASKRSDLIIVTGGLGPTDDDLTREAFQLLTNKKLTEDQLAMEKITNFFLKANRQMTPNNRKQARVFDDAIVLQNETGMAPGMIVEYKGSIWVFLPGVPREMKSITANHVFPYLKEKLELNTVIQSRMLRFIGIGESQLEHDLKSLIDAQHNPTIAPLASEGEVALRLTARAKTKVDANKLIEGSEVQIMDLVGDYFYGYDDVTIQEKVFHLLKNKNWTISSAESLTGGKFADEFVSISGASAVFNGAVVSYATEAKKNLLEVDSNTIDQYGTVSKQCAEEMAHNVKGKLNSTLGISFTGVAGPESVEEKSVGTVFISVSGIDTVDTKEFHFQGNREGIRNRTVKKGFELLYKYIQNLK
ncbi:competence/damage-inducible protein A [Aquibacillus kalidii]|uniref:competence/damage-inducible protein A n=1 Tax=Aquibacillus kalidii TaxID=2762597 RepID=UPI0016472D2F|nr:competence/damage-inducible protein A [Aquibacillus kalidii]